MNEDDQILACSWCTMIADVVELEPISSFEEIVIVARYGLLG